MNDKIIERNLTLVAEVTRFVLQNPSILDRLPANFQLILLPENDPDLSLYNLGLLSTYAEQNTPLVMVRFDSAPINFEHNPPQLYIPLAA